MIKLLVNGICGKMGSCVADLALQDPTIELIGRN